MGREHRLALAPESPELGRASPVLVGVLDLDEEGSFSVDVERLLGLLLLIFRRELELVYEVGVRLLPARFVSKYAVHALPQCSGRNRVAVSPRGSVVLLCNKQIRLFV